MQGPDFIIVGAMKSGTSTLQSQLALQPGVFMTTPKEPNYFSNDEIFKRGASWYESLFVGANPGDLKGEASTHYTKLPTYPNTVSRMKRELNSPKLIYVIRNPIERAISHFQHDWSIGKAKDLTESLKTDTTLVQYGKYGWQIEPFVDAFGLKSVHLTSLEQIKADPATEIEAIHAFLGSNQKFVWESNLQAQNASSDRMRQFPFHKLLVDNVVAKSARRLLIPKTVRQKVRDLRTAKSRPEIASEYRSEMEAIFAKDRLQLAEYFPDHPALKLCYPFVECNNE